MDLHYGGSGAGGNPFGLLGPARKGQCNMKHMFINGVFREIITFYIDVGNDIDLFSGFPQQSDIYRWQVVDFSSFPS